MTDIAAPGFTIDLDVSGLMAMVGFGGVESLPSRALDAPGWRNW
jgi:hypothetical protein